MSTEIQAWLADIGLSQYAQAFAENDIDASVLPSLTEDDLRELGLSMGHRKKLMAAIAALGGSAPSSSPPPDPVPAIKAQSVNAPDFRAGERRHLIVMFCDLVGSTALAGTMDPEDWHDIVASYHHMTNEAVSRFGGYVAKNLGDGVMVYFGYPQAEENDAERAVHAGLAILSGIQEINSTLGAKSAQVLAVRVGIHAGSMVLDEHADAFGDTPNVASRVQSAAEPGNLLISPSVHRLVAGLFMVKDLGAFELKGVPEPLHLFRVQRASGSRGRAVHASVMTPLIGREEELKLMVRRMERALTGESQMVLVTSEPGLGKSRLVEEFRKRLNELPHTWIEWGCNQMLSNTPFAAIAEWGRGRFLTEDDEGLRDLEQTLSTLNIDPAWGVALLAPIFDLPIPAGYAPLDLTPVEIRRQQIDCLIKLFHGSSAEQPLVLVVEDVHWVDPTSLQFLAALIQNSDRQAIFLLITCRPEFKAPWPPGSNQTAITLTPLGRGEVRKMVKEVTALHGFDDELMETIVSRTGGVPLFIEEVTRLVLEGKGDGVTNIPPTLQASLTARLDRMGGARDIAQMGAVIGRSFAYAEIQALSRASEDELKGHLDQLVASDLLLAQGKPPLSYYTFKHALIRDAAYEMLLKSHRRDLHRAFAHYLSGGQSVAMATQPELVAHHLTEAGDTKAAIAAWRHVGDMAQKHGAYLEAMSHYDKAIGLAETGDLLSDIDRLQLKISFARATMHGKGYSNPKTHAAFAEAEILAARVEGAVREKIAMRLGMWVGSFTRGEVKAMRAISAQAMSDIQGNQNTIEAAGAHYITGVTSLFAGELVAGRFHLDGAYAITQKTGGDLFQVYSGGELSIRAQGYSGLSRWLMGEKTGSRAVIDEVLARAQTSNHVPSLIITHYIAWVMAALANDPAQAKPHGEGLLELARKYSMPTWQAYGQFFTAWAELGGSDLKSTAREAALGAMKDGLASLQREGIRYTTPYLQALLAEALDQDGQGDTALGLADESLHEADITEQFWFVPQARIIQGQIHRHLGTAEHLAQAEHAFAGALDMARQQQSKVFELRAALALAQLYQSSHRRSLITPLLAETLASGLVKADPPDEAAQVMAMLSSV